jgi:hypothetical protein
LNSGAGTPSSPDGRANEFLAQVAELPATRPAAVTHPEFESLEQIP